MAPNELRQIPTIPSQAHPNVLQRRARWRRKEPQPPLPANMALEELVAHSKLVSHSFRGDPRCAGRVQSLASAWKSFYENSSAEDKEIARPAFTRFVDGSFNLIYSSADLSFANDLLTSLSRLVPHEPAHLLNALARLATQHMDEEISFLALGRLESSFAFMVSSQERSTFRVIGEVLSLYEKEPLHLFRIPAQEFARSASSFLFAHRNRLMQNGNTDLLAYAVSWGTGISTKERVRFMEEVADREEHSLKVNLFTRTLMLAPLLPALSSCSIEAPVPQKLADSFPEIVRVLDNNREMARIEEEWDANRLVSTADRLLKSLGNNAVCIFSEAGRIVH